MLKTSLTRPLVLRHFATTSRIWNAARNGSQNTAESSGTSTETAPVQDAASPSSSSEALTSAVNSGDPKPHNPHDGESSLATRDAQAAYDMEVVKQRVREWSERAALTVRHRTDGFTTMTKLNLSQLGSELNRVTGYEQIDALKRQVVEQEARINATRQAARDAKVAYQQAVIQRSNSQREVNDLLQRKSTWTDSDVSRFTALVREDHGFEQDEARAKTTVDASEDAVEREFSELLRAILSRYHEEQVWSDKIRSASTYGQMAALALNMLVFVMAIIVVEPWKRKRLAQTFEAKMEEMSRSSTALVEEGMQKLSSQLEEQERRWTEGITSITSNRVEPGTPAVLEEASVVVDSSTEPRTTSQQLTMALAATAAFAGAAGWLARAWLG